MAHSHVALDARRADSRRRMWIALAINVALLGATVVGGIVTGSLALLADAGHLLSDVGAIALGLFAATMAARPAGPAAHVRLPALRGPRRARQRASRWSRSES